MYAKGDVQVYAETNAGYVSAVAAAPGVAILCMNECGPWRSGQRRIAMLVNKSWVCAVYRFLLGDDGREGSGRCAVVPRTNHQRGRAKARRARQREREKFESDDGLAMRSFAAR